MESINSIAKVVPSPSSRPHLIKVRKLMRTGPGLGECAKLLDLSRLARYMVDKEMA